MGGFATDSYSFAQQGLCLTTTVKGENCALIILTINLAQLDVHTLPGIKSA